MRRRRNYQVRPTRAGSIFGVVIGAVFVLIGFTVVLPNAGIFGLFWTGIAVAIMAFQIYILVSGKGAYRVEMEEEALPGPEEASQGIAGVEERLQTLQRLYDQRLITREEYDRKRQEILSEKW